MRFFKSHALVSLAFTVLHTTSTVDNSALTSNNKMVELLSCKNENFDTSSGHFFEVSDSSYQNDTNKCLITVVLSRLLV